MSKKKMAVLADRLVHSVNFRRDFLLFGAGLALGLVILSGMGQWLCHADILPGFVRDWLPELMFSGVATGSVTVGGHVCMTSLEK